MTRAFVPDGRREGDVCMSGSASLRPGNVQERWTKFHASTT